MDSLVEQERRLLNRLAVIKLASQILDQRTDLSPQQRRLVRTAVEACDELTLGLFAWRQAQAARFHDGRSGDAAPLAAAPPDRVASTDGALERSSSSRGIDAIVIAHDRQERKQLEEVLARQGYGVQSADRIDSGVEQLLADRRRLAVLSPDPDVGQAEIEAQVRRVRTVAPRSAILVCLDPDQAPRTVEDEQLAILRRPFRSRDLLRRMAQLYPADPPGRLPTARPSS